MKDRNKEPEILLNVHKKKERNAFGNRSIAEDVSVLVFSPVPKEL